MAVEDHGRLLIPIDCRAVGYCVMRRLKHLPGTLAGQIADNCGTSDGIRTHDLGLERAAS